MGYTGGMTIPKTARLSVRMNLQTVAALERLTDDEVTATEVVRRAFALLDVIQTARNAGKDVELVNADGVRELLKFMY